MGVTIPYKAVVKAKCDNAGKPGARTPGAEGFLVQYVLLRYGYIPVSSFLCKLVICLPLNRLGAPLGCLTSLHPKHRRTHFGQEFEVPVRMSKWGCLLV